MYDKDDFKIPKKLCIQCNEEKMLLEFGARIRALDGLQTYCKDCCRANRKRYESKNPLKAGITEKQKKKNRVLWNARQKGF